MVVSCIYANGADNDLYVQLMFRLTFALQGSLSKDVAEVKHVGIIHGFAMYARSPSRSRRTAPTAISVPARSLVRLRSAIMAT